MRRSIILALALGVSLGSQAVVLSGEWPQILGPNRNGNASEEHLAASWPADGPRVRWQRSVGDGLSGVAVAQGKAILFHRIDDQQWAEAMDATTGKVLWKRGFLTRYASGISPDNGPRCVPVIHKDSVYLHDAEGIVYCLRLENGASLWKRDLKADYSAPEGYFGAGSTPIVEGDRLLVNVGGRDGAGLVALSLKTGKTLWKATDEGASYSSPVAVTLEGTRHVVFITRLNCVSVNPVDGEVRFRIPFGKRGPTVNGANPLIVGDQVFLTASYGIGATMAKMSDRDAQVVWQAADVMSSQYTTCVQHEGVLYGIDGRQDIGVAQLRAIDPRQGKVHWTREGFGMATLIEANGKLVILKTNGELVLAKATPQAYQELASAQLFNGTTRALPALAGGLLYARDGRTLKCVELGKPKSR